MRIVSGKLRARKLECPADAPTRPMADRPRQALFNVLDHGKPAEGGNPYIGEHVLDAFAGTGALGIEALSRGAKFATFLDLDTRAVEINIKNLSLQNQAVIFRADATKPPPAQESAALIFLAPPYRQGLIEPAFTALQAKNWFKKNALIVAEWAKDEVAPALENTDMLDQRSYGLVQIGFFRFSAA
ncbi:MAG: 16S rRNA (guanine(966)-N(2))-methyltransferase RsmD [Dongiaceae bacterium]